ncbi:MAG: isoprenylcysteine carboxylmethyltransferase family protein [Pseudomonadota bacterium]
MRWLEKRIPPPVAAMIGVALLIGAKTLWPSLSVRSLTQTIAGGLLIITGVAIDVAAIVAFRRARTTINPLRPEASSALVTDGPFQRSRNPMYVGLMVIVAGSAVAVGSFLGPVIVVVVALYLTRFQIQPEERVMRELFGEPFAQYCEQVPRWL